MTQPFVAQLRARGTALQLAPVGAPSITVRIQMPEVWDTVKAIVSPNEPITSLKVHALAALSPVSNDPAEFVLKLHGWEVLDESATLADAGAKDGSIFLLTNRRRRAVR